MTKTANFENPRWWTAAILKIVKSSYLSILSDFDKIWCTTADIEPDAILKKFASEILIFGHVTVFKFNICYSVPIFIKIGTL